MLGEHRTTAQAVAGALIVGLLGFGALNQFFRADGTYVLDFSNSDWVDANGVTFDGIGAISGGGATTRLLPDYDEDARNEILDFLFLPNFGASLHILKIEIGGGEASTDGSESSHMQTEHDLNFDRGYEWWLIKEARKRNPNIKLYALPWGFPGWISHDSHDPYKNIDKLVNYTVSFLVGARDVHGLKFESIGAWNERSTNAEYIIALRKSLDAHGLHDTSILITDAWIDHGLINVLKSNPEYQAAVGAFGFHYPNEDPSFVKDLKTLFNKPVWSSEESSSYDDANGAACWARVLAAHYVKSNITSSIMWNLVGSYMAGTNWFASSLLTAVQPWSGYYEYESMPVVWATAHYTQFTEIGWKMLPVNHGSGELSKGGFFITFISPCKKYFSIVVVKISLDHAKCTRPGLPQFSTFDEIVSFDILTGDKKSLEQVDVWYSNFEQDASEAPIFEKNPSTKAIFSNSNSKITLNVTIGSVFTVTNRLSGQKGVPKVRRLPNASFPIPYDDDFNSYSCTNCYAKYLSDQQGIFELHESLTTPNTTVIRQMSEEVPTMWDFYEHGTCTLVGMQEWEDVRIDTVFSLPEQSGGIPPAACVAIGVEQRWSAGVSLCVTAESWYILYGGPKMAVWPPAQFIKNGTTSLAVRQWNSLSLESNDGFVSAKLNGKTLVSQVAVRNRDSGFALLGSNGYFQVEFKEIKLVPVSNNWKLSTNTVSSFEGSSLHMDRCAANGVRRDDQYFELKPNWQILHVPSKTCVTADDSGFLSLQPCKHNYSAQEFRNDYTTIRNQLKDFSNAKGQLCATKDTAKAGSLNGANCRWIFFHNTYQIRNQNSYSGGAPQCLTAKSSGISAIDLSSTN